MAKTKEIQRRIKSVKNTRKITKAMEMVAASKMRRAVEGVLKTRTYANLSWTTVLNCAQAINAGGHQNPIFVKRENPKNIAIILISSNRGLCGGFNTAILNKAHESVKKHEQKNHDKINHEFILVGKRGLSVRSRLGYTIAAEFPKTDICYSVEEVRPIARLVMDDFLSGKYDKVFVAYTDYESTSKQIPRVKQLLPIDTDAKDDHLGIVGKDTRVGIDKEFIKEKEDKYLQEGKDKYVFTYEPDAETVLAEMLPRLIEVQLYQALLESNASEHSARMTAMHQANEAAGDLVNQLTLFYNKARQAAITAEIAEISAGADALSE